MGIVIDPTTPILNAGRSKPSVVGDSDSPKSTARKSENSATAKGSTRKPHAGLIQQFTGISDPYEIPTDAEVVIDTTEIAAEKAA